MGQLDTQREALRLRSVQDVIQARNIQSEIAYRETSGDLNRQQAANLRAVEPHLAAEMLAKIDQHKEAADASRATRVREETLLPIKVQQEQAQTEQYQAQTRRVNELLSYEKRRIDADINQSMASAGASNASAERARMLAPREAALLDKQNDEYVKMKLGGQEFSAKGMDLAKERNDNIQLMARLAKEREEKIANARKDQRTELKMSADAERNLKALRPGGFALQNSSDHSELGPDIEEFHATSKQPYVYTLETDPGYGIGKAGIKLQRRDLPKVDGHQYTAQEVYDAANAEGRNMTVQQYLEQVFYPMIKQPVPWNTGVTSTIK